MKKTITLLIIAILIFCFVSCSEQNDYKNSKVSSSKNNSYPTEINRSESFEVESSSIRKKIKEYTVINNNRPLKLKTIGEKSLDSLVQNLDVCGRRGIGGMELYIIDYLYSIDEFRKAKVENEKMYYCAYKDKSDKKRIYIFFWKLNEWSCYDYVELKMNTSGYNVQHGKDMVKYINSLDLQ